MAAPKFYVGQKVLLSNRPCVIVEIQKPDNGHSGTFNMGRYKVRYDNGDTLANAPGYLMVARDG